MMETFDALLAHGELVQPTKGANRELRGVTLELTNPRARLSRTETRGKPFSCLGELLWYLSGSDDVGHIEYYVKFYRKYEEDGRIHGAYGPRLRSMRGIDQVQSIVALLREKPSTRRAAIQLFDAEDIAHDRNLLPDGHKDIPCTCTLQFLNRNERLNMVVFMRSNDAWRGLPHDIFCFTMLQELVARQLSVEVGVYTHMVGSIHLYANDEAQARRVASEGWQSTAHPMPPMPAGDQWPDVEKVRRLEKCIREARSFDDALLGTLPPYWRQLVHLLAAYSYYKHSDFDRLSSPLLETRDSPYFVYIEQLAARSRIGRAKGSLLNQNEDNEIS